MVESHVRNITSVPPAPTIITKYAGTHPFNTSREYHRKFLCLFLFGFRMRAISILGREVMLPRGLVGLGLDTLDHSGPEIAQVVTPTLPRAIPSKITSRTTGTVRSVANKRPSSSNPLYPGQRPNRPHCDLSPLDPRHLPGRH